MNVMTDLSIFEYAAYAFLSYSSILMLIISTIKEVPISKALSIIRVIYLIPGMVSSAIIANSGNFITGLTHNVTNNIITRSGNGTITSNSTSTLVDNSSVLISSPVWTMVHMMIMFVLLVYIIQQILIFMTSRE